MERGWKTNSTRVSLGMQCLGSPAERTMKTVIFHEFFGALMIIQSPSTKLPYQQNERAYTSMSARVFFKLSISKV